MLSYQFSLDDGLSSYSFDIECMFCVQRMRAPSAVEIEPPRAQGMLAAERVKNMFAILKPFKPVFILCILPDKDCDIYGLISCSLKSEPFETSVRWMWGVIIFRLFLCHLYFQCCHCTLTLFHILDDYASVCCSSSFKMLLHGLRL